MDEETSQPQNPVIPPPDIPKPNIPPPDIPKPSEPIPPIAGAPLVNVKIRDAGAAADELADDGGLAPFNSRVIAALIDVVLSIGLQITVMFIMPAFADRLAWVVGVAYLIARDSLPFLGGQSVGKKAMKLKVVTLEEKSIVGNWEAAGIRNAVLLIPFFGLIEIFVLLSREGKPEHGRRLGDEWSKTKVIIATDPVPNPEEAT